MLAQTLHALNGDGLVLRHDHREVPPRVEYTLTPKGLALTPLIEAMREWGQTWDEAPAGPVAVEAAAV